MRNVIIGLFLLFIPVAWAHENHESSNWNRDPFTIISLIMMMMIYLLGVRNAAHQSKKKEHKKIVFFLSSMTFLIIALISPLDPLSDRLSSAHMIQHMVIMMLAAPLFVSSSPLYYTIWALPRFLRVRLTPLTGWFFGKSSGRYFFYQPVILWIFFALTLWLWHFPQLYQAALLNRWIHDFQHICFFMVSCLFWRILLDPVHRFQLSTGLAILYVFTTSLHAMMLGAFMALSPKVWYRFYEGKTLSWNMDALEDQQVAGFIMWMPACSIYVLVTVFIFYQWMKKNGREEKRV
jgi:putative membrane protein